VINHAIIIESQVPGILSRQVVRINPFINLGTVIIVRFLASLVVLVSEHGLGEGQILFYGYGIDVGQVVELSHFIEEVLAESV
jgi:hypothetical protein